MAEGLALPSSGDKLQEVASQFGGKVDLNLWTYQKVDEESKMKNHKRPQPSVVEVRRDPNERKNKKNEEHKEKECCARIAAEEDAVSTGG